MKLTVRFTMLALGALLLASPVLAQVSQDDPIIGYADGDHRPVLLPMFSMIESPPNLSGILSDVTVNPNNTCFSAVPDNAFKSGETVALNVFFEDTVEGDQFNEYTITWAVRKQGRVIPVGTFACDYDLGGFTPGELLSFCCFVTELVPTPPVPIPIQFNIDWGARIIKVQNGFTGQAILGNATISSF